jgi:uncharacterized protein involved in exopolysaccharide biosynthesis
MAKSNPVTASVPETPSRLRSALTAAPYAIVVVGFVTAAVYVAANRFNPVYTATATVAVEAVGSATANGQRADILSTQMQIVKSRDIARAVVGNLDLVDGPDLLAEPTWFGRAVAGLGLRSDEVPLGDRAVEQYFARLGVVAGTNPGEIAISFSDRTGAAAAAGANAVAEAYVARQQSMRREALAEASAVLGAQVAAQRSKVSDAEARLARYRSDHPVPTPVSSDRIVAMERDLSAAAASREEAEQQVSSLESLIRAGDPAAIAVSSVASDQLKSLASRRAAAQAELNRLGETRVPQDPRMRELAGEVSSLDREIAAAAAAMLTVLRSDAARAASSEAAITGNLARLRQASADGANIAALTATLEREVSAQHGILAAYVAHEEAAVAAAVGVANASMVAPATVPQEANPTSALGATLAGAVLALVLSTLVIVVRTSRRGKVVAGGAGDAPPKREDGSSTIGPDRALRSRVARQEPTLVPEMVDRAEDSLVGVAAEIGRSAEKRVLVTLAEGSDRDGRPLGAVALARELARNDARVVLIDLRRDGANVRSMGEGADHTGFSDLFRGESSFAQVIFRDRRSRVHFIPCGRAVLPTDGIDREHLETVLSALSLTYDYVLLDVPDDLIDLVGPSCGIAMVVSESGAGDVRTARALARIAGAVDLRTLLLVVDPVAAPVGPREPRIPSDVAA